MATFATWPRAMVTAGLPSLVCIKTAPEKTWSFLIYQFQAIFLDCLDRLGVGLTTQKVVSSWCSLLGSPHSCHTIPKKPNSAFWDNLKSEKLGMGKAEGLIPQLRSQSSTTHMGIEANLQFTCDWRLGFPWIQPVYSVLCELAFRRYISRTLMMLLQYPVIRGLTCTVMHILKAQLPLRYC